MNVFLLLTVIPMPSVQIQKVATNVYVILAMLGMVSPAQV